MTDASLAVRLGPLALRNPVLVASGTYGSGTEAAGLGVDLARIGGVVTKSVTTKPRRGNPPPRIHETAAGMLNSIGIMNPGLERFVAEVMPALSALPCARIVNIAGESEEDFVGLAEAFDSQDGVDALELNVSCPNVSGGLDFGTDPALLERLVGRCRRATGRPLIVKLTPNVTRIADTARAAERGGADILSLVNTFVGLAVDWRRRRPELGSATGEGGLSGPAIKPLALAALRRVRAATSLPLIGIGGIFSVDDTMEFLVCGASAIQLGTANFRDPSAAIAIVQGLEQLVRTERLGALTDWIGSLKAPRPTYS